ncbi:MAG: outer membrane lipid asymmetry maintenance protein MlaD [Alphaproteobacteria bacterium]|jgi:phospholipid/cholesterol/gamma-HCH transport system substrate-binding protein|nr:outer membrane lipid asymmetry maintenance protein MlaD [Alphaproteobacteria bacterium]MDP6515175.1 outer membrane lipid asymmetry maintenance protein MlaD [Alphaproteobacteria bacterium]|tara:strand:- start:168 stop:617 length:450 start_codon:yes stop_codon:yes gene_type:complete
MNRNALETLIGALVIVVAVWFVTFAYTKSDVGTVSGYQVIAKFTGIGALKEGADVRISGIKVGSVTAETIDPDTYLALVTMNIDEAIKLPLDTTAMIGAEGLLGGEYVRLDPGGEEDMIRPGGEIEYTQAAADVIGLLTQLVFSQKESK